MKSHFLIDIQVERLEQSVVCVHVSRTLATATFPAVLGTAFVSESASLRA